MRKHILTNQNSSTSSLELLVLEWLLLQQIDIVSHVWILNKVVCISHNVDTLEKGMHPTILSPQLWVNSRADGLPNFGKRRKAEFKPVKTYLKIDLVSHPVHGGGLPSWLAL